MATGGGSSAGGGTAGGASLGGGSAGAGACAPATPPEGWVRDQSKTVFSDVDWANIRGAFWNPFPSSGGLGRITTTHGEYLAVRIDVPADPIACAAAGNKRFFWDPSQVDGEADLSKVFVTIRPCPGDFRWPPAGAAPPNDPTFARGCTSRRPLQGNPVVVPQNIISYRLGAGVSDELVCELQCGRSYFINFIRADLGPTGAVRSPALEVVPGFSSNCDTTSPTATRCGVQMRYF